MLADGTHLQVPLVELHGYGAGHGVHRQHLAAVNLAANSVAKIARRHRAQRPRRLIKYHGHELQPLRREQQRVLRFSLQRTTGWKARRLCGPPGTERAGSLNHRKYGRNEPSGGEAARKLYAH